MCVVQYLFTCVHVTTGSLDDAVAQRKANNTKQKRNVWDEEVNIGLVHTLVWFHLDRAFVLQEAGSLSVIS